MASNNVFKKIDWVMVLYFAIYLVLTQELLNWINVAPTNFLAKTVVEGIRAIVGFGISRIIFKKR